MVEWMQNLMNELGYLGIFLLMILENLFPPIPSELIMPSAGFAAARGDLHLLGVVAAGALGSVIGTLPLYFIGRAYGEKRLIEWADKHGKWLTLSGKDIKRADDWFDRYGSGVVLFGRLVPGIRSLLSLPAGMSEMPLPKFMLFSALGSALWAALLAYAGYVLGDNYEEVEHLISPISKVVLGLVALWAAYMFIGRRRKQSAE